MQDIPSKIEATGHALTVTELSTILSISKSNLYAQAKRGAVPCFYFAGSVRFDPARIAAWLRGDK